MVGSADDHGQQSCTSNPNGVHKEHPASPAADTTRVFDWTWLECARCGLIAARDRTRLRYGGPGGSKSRPATTFHRLDLHRLHRTGSPRSTGTNHRWPHCEQSQRTACTVVSAICRSIASIMPRPVLGAKRTTPLGTPARLVPPLFPARGCGIFSRREDRSAGSASAMTTATPWNPVVPSASRCGCGLR